MSLEGQQIERYHILRLLGSGGMGEVYLAEDARIEQQVAIKVIRAEASHYPNTQASQETARLFQREAKAIAKLDHPHVLPLFAYGEERLGNLTVIYLVMPYRREGSLSDWLRQRSQVGLLSPQEIAHFVSQAASALQHAHDHQIIHQDVKPSNFLLRHRSETPTRPDLLLADFGIARFSTATSSASQSIRGTPTSMAPEQWEGHPVAATDQYALAIMAYELLTGRPPFQGAPGPLMYQHLTVPPPPPSSLNPRLSSEIDAMLLHALAKRPEQRFASVLAFANAFQQAAQAMPEADAPTLRATAPKPPDLGDIQAVLAISAADAQTGTTRTLTLPGGRQVRVPVPAGVRDGQVMRLEGEGEASPEGDTAGALILTLLVKAAEEAPSFPTASATLAEKTVLTANAEAAAARVPTISNTGQPPGVSGTVRPEMSTPTSGEVSPSEMATPASQGSSSLRELVLPSKPSAGAPDTLTSPEPAKAKRGISRRTVLVGLGLAGLAVAGGSLTWLVSSRTSVSPTAVVQGNQLPTPTSFKTTRSKDVNVSVQYPGDWVAETPQKSTSFTSLIIHTPQQQQTGIEFFVARYTDTTSASITSPDEINQANVSGIGQQQNDANVQVVSSGQPTIGGTKWSQEDATYVDGTSNTKIHFVTISAQHNKIYYNIAFLVPDQYYGEAMQKYIQHMLDSFQFLS